MPHPCRFFPQVISGPIVVFLFVLFSAVPGQTGTFPFLAEATADRVNVRAGQNQNFERLCQLEKGEEVIALEQSFGWYKIQLPIRVPVYVSDKYVGRLDNIYGEILVDRVNVRAATGTQATIVGQLKKGDRVRVLARREGWYTIEPPPQVFGWVAQEFVKFKSADTAAYRPRPVPATAGSPQPGEETPVSPVPSSGSSTAKIVSVTGYLRANSSAGDSGISYKLVVSDRPAYDVQGLKPMLDDFVRYMVTIEGTLITEPGSPFSRPGINVSKIQLVL
ncbi:MAG: SH3 domain-containing protein [Candidatus Omnitrophica bacterium]|nr:SH3 domain-containing protein [Candidatus Omnitrophota bacterium]